MPDQSISDEQLREVGEWLMGTSRTELDALEHFELHGVDEDELLDRLLDINVEQCSICGWWDESGSLNANGECEDCLEDIWDEADDWDDDDWEDEDDDDDDV